MHFSSVLLGVFSAGFGVVLGAILERWRDDIRWKREEQARWSSDLRVLHRDLLASGDEFFNALGHSRRLETRMKSKSAPVEESESERLVQIFTGALDAMDREYKKVLALTADIQLIGSKEESDAALLLALQVVGGTALPSDGDFKKSHTQYLDAKKKLIEVARASLRRV